MEASQQIGQSLLTLPWIFSTMGYGAATVLLLLFSFLSIFTQYILISLLSKYRSRISSMRTEQNNHFDDSNNEVVSTNLEEGTSTIDKQKSSMSLSQQRSAIDHHVVSYHEIMGELGGHKLWGQFSLLVVFVALLGLSTVQIISTASNLYLLNSFFLKRTYTLIVGAIFSLIVLLPTFRHYRTFSFVALLATFYTAWYMTISSAATAPIENVQYREGGENASLQQFFSAFTALLFMFGGHTAAIEKADVMDDRRFYAGAYATATIYVYCITLPTGISAYHTYGTSIANHHTTNAFYLFPSSVYRDIGLVLMCVHEFVAFGLFCGPLFHMWEKFLKVAPSATTTIEMPLTRKLWVQRTTARLFVVAIMILIAVAIPFFGTINGFLGAFTTTFGSFIIPCIVYNLSFGKTKIGGEDDTDHVLIPKWTRLNDHAIRILNWIVAIVVGILGVGIGGWAAMSTLIENVEKFQLFDPCYGC